MRDECGDLCEAKGCDNQCAGTHAGAGSVHYTSTGRRLAALGSVCLYLLIRMVFAWQLARSQNADALARQQVDLTTARIAAMPLEGLDAKITTASGSADRFYRERLPVSYSEVAGELGDLKKKDGVRLTRVQYAQRAVSGEAAGQLTEVDMDASLSGDYRALMLFINGLERDRMFFLITGVNVDGADDRAGEPAPGVDDVPARNAVGGRAAEG